MADHWTADEEPFLMTVGEWMSLFHRKVKRRWRLYIPEYNSLEGLYIPGTVAQGSTMITEVVFLK